MSETSFSIRIGPVSIRFNSCDFPYRCVKDYTPFITEHTADYSLSVRFIGNSVNTEGTVGLIHNNNTVVIKREDFNAQIDLAAKKGWVEITDNPLSFNSFLRVLASLLLPFKHAALFHSSGLIIDGRAFMFVGKSGAGKSTIIKNTPHAENIGDEIVGIIKRNNIFYACSTPFGGELTAPRKNIEKPLQAVYLIKKSKKIRIRKAPMNLKMQTLLRCVMNFSRDKQAVSNITEYIYDIIKSVPVYELHTRIDSSFIKIYNEYIDVSDLAIKEFNL